MTCGAEPAAVVAAVDAAVDAAKDPDAYDIDCMDSRMDTADVVDARRGRGAERSTGRGIGM